MGCSVANKLNFKNITDNQGEVFKLNDNSLVFILPNTMYCRDCLNEVCCFLEKEYTTFYLIVNKELAPTQRIIFESAIAIPCKEKISIGYGHVGKVKTNQIHVLKKYKNKLSYVNKKIQL